MKEFAHAQDWNKLEDSWLEGLASDQVDLASFMDAAEAAAHHDRKRSVELLNLLAGELLTRGRHGDAGAALRQAVRLAPANAETKHLVERLLMTRSDDSRVAQRLLDFAGFDQAPVADAWDRFEAIDALRSGAYILHDTWGAGKVVEFETATEEVALDFVGRRGHRMSWGMALRALRPLSPEHLLAMTVDRSDVMAALPPIELLGLAVRSLGGDADLKDVKRLVEPVVGTDAWTAWWSKARSDAKDDPRLHISLAKPMRIRWVETGGPLPPDSLTELKALPHADLLRTAPRIARDPALLDGVCRVLRERLGSMRKNVPLLLEALLVLDNLGDDQARTEAEDLMQGSADPTGTVLAIRSADLRREGMIILEGRGDPAAVRKDLFLRSGNAADWEALNRRMNTAERTELGWEVHRGLPERAAAYFWMVRKTEEGFPLPGAPLDRAIRLVGLLDEASGLVGPVTSFIAEGRVLQRAVENSREKAETLLRFVSEARLPVSLKDEILTDVYARFPVLRPSHELIYTTPAGLGTKEDELRQLVKVELPQNRAAIAEAKAHGDLRENFEYKAAKEQQDRILARIDEIQADLSRVRMLTPETVDISAVSPGCVVTLVGKGNETCSIVILGPWESDPDAGVFSYRAPAIRPLLGRRPGDVVALDLPQASGAFRIGAIAPWRSPA